MAQGSTGTFWLFSRENVELTLKVLDGAAINGNSWVFFGSLSNAEFSITVTDTLTDLSNTYQNPPGTFASVGDTAAFSAN